MTGAKDARGRALIWAQLRFHDTRTSGPVDMARLLATAVLHALRGDPEAQQQGVVLLSESSGIGLGNLDPRVPKLLFGSVLPRLPVRLARVVVFDPPFLVGRVLFPIISTFMSRKIKTRLTLIHGRDLARLYDIYPPAMLTAAFGGSFTPLASALGRIDPGVASG